MGAEACVHGALLSNHGPANTSYGCHRLSLSSLASCPSKDKLVAAGLKLLLQSTNFALRATSYPWELPPGRSFLVAVNPAYAVGKPPAQSF